MSLDRPYALYWNGFPAGFEPLTNGSREFLIEHPLAFWLEKEGYDEYWTKEMFANVTRARDLGVSLAFLSGNAVSGSSPSFRARTGDPTGSCGGSPDSRARSN